VNTTLIPSTATLLSRRQLIMGGVCACCVSGLGRTRSAGGSAAQEAVGRIEQIAPGIHMRRGIDEDATPANQGAIANIGFLVGRTGVAVMDPGGSLADGMQLRRAIRAVTQLPIRYVVMSHVHPDHVFGAAAFNQDNPEFVGHAKLPQALAERGEYYRKRLELVLGKGNAGSVIAPQLLVQGQTTIDLGDRVLELTAHGVAHSDCDLSVLDRQTQTLLAADLLFVERVPSLDGSLRGWLTELAQLKTGGARRAVPGHGPTSVKWPAAASGLERYLNTLRRETRLAIGRGVDIGEAARTVAQSERPYWKLFDDYHGHNVTRAYKELEWE
jgi:quinoprotein relay system zinc metallohydrolase 2